MTQLPIIDRLKRGLSGVVGDRRANAAVEFALGAPVLFMFVLGIIETSNALWIQNALDYSVAQAARCASLNVTGTSCVGSSSQVAAYAAGEAGAGLTSSAFTYNRTAACGCQVTGSYTMALDIPWDNALSVNLSSSACVAPPPTKSCAS